MASDPTAVVKIYETAFKTLILNAKRLRIGELEEKEDVPENNEEYSVKSPTNLRELKCSYCNVVFGTVQEQREHYKLDWHRYNLSRRIEAQTSLSEDQFNQLSLNPKEEEASDSDSSDSESETDEVTHLGCGFYKNDQQQVFSLYKCFRGKEEEGGEIVELQKDKLWTILMVSGGHFAGAVFQNGKPLLHKTFHCYTVRAKQGGSQVATDSRKGSAYPKSAGASLRRYNQSVLVQSIQDLLSEWKTHIESSSFVFCRAAGPHNRAILFGGKYPPLRKQATNVRIIPFSTKRPTFTEVQHVYDKLTFVPVYSNHEEVLQMLNAAKAQQKPAKKPKPPRPVAEGIKTNIAEEAEVKKSPKQVEAKKHQRPVSQRSSLSSDDGPIELNTSEEILDISESIKPFEQTRKPRRRNRERLHDKKILLDATIVGNLDVVQFMLGEKYKGLLNESMDNDKNRLLHFASKNGHKDLVVWLLEFGANPCSKNLQNQSSFAVCKNVEIEETFRNFAVANPEKHDYGKAGIPVPNALRQKKKEEKKLEKKLKKKEQNDLSKYLELVDTEKRNLTVKRCFLCGVCMGEKAIPFEYNSNKFCSINCLRQHRFQ